MFYAVARFDLQIPESQSLKAKRAVLNHLKARVQNRYHCSIAEVDHQDLWQRSALGIALVVSGMDSGRDAIAAIRRELEQADRVIVLDTDQHVAKLGDEDEWEFFEDTPK